MASEYVTKVELAQFLGWLRLYLPGEAAQVCQDMEDGLYREVAKLAEAAQEAPDGAE